MMKSIHASPEVLDYVSSLEPSSHAVLFYDSKEVAAQIFAAYIDGGIERGEAIYFIGPSREHYRNLLDLAGVRVTSLERGGQLKFISIQDFYLEMGHLSYTRVLQTIQLLLSDDGFKGARLISLTDALLQNVSPQDLAHYERKVGETFPFPISAICSYDAQKTIDQVGHDFLIDLLKMHGHNIFQGLAAPRIESQI